MQSIDEILLVSLMQSVVMRMMMNVVMMQTAVQSTVYHQLCCGCCCCFCCCCCDYFCCCDGCFCYLVVFFQRSICMHGLTEPGCWRGPNIDQAELLCIILHHFPVDVLVELIGWVEWVGC